ncbi:unnamed protein product [Adineta steineri]|uniref:LITAF domain-containing protein n=1 Tax=Adineta steineri TaxID=433720 RepID=A0A814H323_9BILA|nr:unnamed protein product [Adineta steineri]CAF1004662.1 unnamed protein product [Adineta steineri]CAF3504741.1 unnamed protein product [Adineta steineri]CAF4266401.1 unnamed protein product [Adineta steineri]
MSDDYHESPPSYAKFIEKSVRDSPNDRPAVYDVQPVEPLENIRCPEYNEIQNNSIIQLGEKPFSCTCNNCHSSIVTYVEHTPGFLPWFSCVILVMCGCCLGCCLIPFCIREIQNTQHYCPNCEAFIGEYHPL